jgi:diaminopimelate decarboxylase
VHLDRAAGGDRGGVGAGVLIPAAVDAGLVPGPDGVLQMGGVSLGALAEAVGTPAFVYDAAIIRRRYAALDAAFGTLPHRICYAVKANGNLAILHLLAGLGAGADIVSGGELLRALAAGMPPAAIVFSGVGKTDDELLAAIAVGVGHINVESVGELARLAMLADGHGATTTVGIRINPDVTVDTHPYISTGKGGLKFGVPIDQVDRAFDVLDDAPALRLGALAMHVGSQLLEAAPYRTGLERLVGVLDAARARGFAPDTLDLGGGLGIRYHEEVPMEPHDWIVPLRDMLAATGCTVQIEPGRYLVGNAGVLVTRVVQRKRSGGRDIVVVDAGMNDLMRPALYHAWHEVVTVDAVAGEAMPTDVVGPVCETGDTFGLERMLPPVQPGHLMAILGAGAYGFAMSSNYNTRARAAEVLVDDGRWAIVRPRERLADVYRDEVADPFGGATA